jgi:hypothetical protein
MVDLLLWLPRFKSCALILSKMSLSNKFIMIIVLAYLETAYLSSSQGVPREGGVCLDLAFSPEAIVDLLM